MKRSEWMYEIGRHTNEYQKNLADFMEVAEADRVVQGNSRISCPCVDCKNCVKYDEAREIHRHLVVKGFVPGYTCWSYHGELLVDSGVDDINENDNDHAYHNLDHDNFTEMFNVLRKKATKNVNDNESGGDDVDDAYDDDDATENDEFQQVFADSKEDLYNGCKKYSKLSAVLNLFTLKADYGWSDASFKRLLEVVHDMLPEDNVLPVSLYEAKKMLCPMGMEVERIPACPNDCMLYRNEHSDLHECLKCGASRYERKKTKAGDDVKKNPPPAKVLWYFPIIPRLRRLFANPRDAKLLRWHDEERKNDGKIRHVADSPQWRNIDTFDDFGDEIRNLRFGLSSDGINIYERKPVSSLL